MCINIHNINNNTRPLKDVVKIMASKWYTAQLLLYKTQLNPPATSGNMYKTQLNPPATSGKTQLNPPATS